MPFERPCRSTGRSSQRSRRRDKQPSREVEHVIDTVSILDGNTFVVSDRRGDMEATPTENHGLFLNDTRFLSRWVLTIDGLRPTLLSADDLAYFRVQFFLALATGHDLRRFAPVDRAPAIRVRRLPRGARDRQPRSPAGDAAGSPGGGVGLRRSLRGQGQAGEEGRALSQGRQRPPDCSAIGAKSFRRETIISSSAPAEMRDDGLSFEVYLEPQSSWTHVAGRLRRSFLRAIRDPKPRPRGPQRARATAADGPRSREVGRRGAAAGGVVGAAGQHLQAQPGRPGGAALRDRHHAGRAAGGRLALVHGDLRPRQLDHQLPGAAVRARAGRDDAAHAGAVPGPERWIRSATRSRARSCTSCASAS